MYLYTVSTFHRKTSYKSFGDELFEKNNVTSYSNLTDFSS